MTQALKKDRHNDALLEVIKGERTDGINRAQALKLKHIVSQDSSGHDCMGWDCLERLIHEAGYSTIVFPLAEGKSYNRNTRNFRMYWAMVDRGSSTRGVCQTVLADTECKQHGHPIYCYGLLRPVQDYVGLWGTMALEDCGYVADAGPIKNLLAKQTEWSHKEGRGSSAAENHCLWKEDFAREWPEGTDKVLKPGDELPIKRLKFLWTFLQPETKRFREAWKKDDAEDQA